MKLQALIIEIREANMSTNQYEKNSENIKKTGLHKLKTYKDICKNKPLLPKCHDA